MADISTIEIIKIDPEAPDKSEIKITTSQPDIVETLSEAQVNAKITQLTNDIIMLQNEIEIITNDRQKKIDAIQVELGKYTDVKGQITTEKEKLSLKDPVEETTVNP